MPIHSLSDLKKESSGQGQDAYAPAIDGEKAPKFFKGIYHEKQVGSLCAVHCLNNLLQGGYFDEIMFAEVGHHLDREEQMAMGGAVLGESNNVRADGFFSVQVIQLVLQRAGLTCTPFGSAEAKHIRANPAAEKGYVLNRSEHWFTLRKIGDYWFELNSMCDAPKRLTPTFVSNFLQQFQADGYSIFIVQGDYPVCELEKPHKKKELKEAAEACTESTAFSGGAINQPAESSTTAFTGSSNSLRGGPAPSSAPAADIDPAMYADDPELAAAIAASLQDVQPTPQPTPPEPSIDPAEEMRRKRLARFGG
mmetsp:Transcript_39325/g.47649  ORF Transcript_39325/g.47649 Transcript_39325/m.47649 type:complete len:308 (+) Transcript_39325:135-1058(+)|eukprot:CAMPEP_0197848626 /NCGR_PEP_ID=MMETSP1438-20131217/9393_1 /TAXON_ID=1461541 /ORGANISM="Pterosperma sp., Strain CCMP1384" /LENGTH=307 /DNA_ID=CAMNT_0043460965 /DNA_START=133 /DNA_END=1056 /DNA_ORIENTATION=+